MQAFDEGYYDLHGSSQQFDHQPVVLLSTERSGSNLLRSILNTHSDIAAPHPLEIGFPWRNIAPLGSLSPTDRRRLVRDSLLNKQYSSQPVVEPLGVDDVHRRVENANDKSFLTMQEALYTEYADLTDATHWVTKDPSVWGYFDELRDYYDRPKVVYLVRDARDVALSFKHSNIGLSHPYFSAKRWQDEQSDGRSLLDEMGDDIAVVRYQDLLEEPETEIERLCSFLDLAYQQEMLYFYETEGAQEAAEQTQLFENLSIPIKSDNYGKFHDGLSTAETQIVEAIAGEELEAFDFDLVTDPDERAKLRFDEATLERADRKRRRRQNLSYWRDRPMEQLRRTASASFSRYMVLRYGLFA